MAVEVVTLDNTFNEWRQKCNNIASAVGDKDSLTTVDKTSLVNAINETQSTANSFSVAVAIALG